MHVCIFSLYTFYLLLLSWQASITVWTILMISKSSWRLLKPKRLTLALHHNTSNLDYSDFLPSSYCQIQIHNYFHMHMCVCVCVWIFTQSLHMSSMQHKVNFLSGIQGVWILSFSSPRLVATPRLKSLVCPTIYL